VLDNPHREEIVRVINLDLMQVDATQHRFFPGSAVRRGPALRVVLRTLARFGAAACAGNSEGGDVCEPALACSLVADADDCQASDPLSGADGVEILRRSLKLLSGS
jgi:hypothetical protein